MPSTQPIEEPAKSEANACYSANTMSMLKPLLDKGYTASIMATDDEFLVTSITGGDPNCPCAKRFDPADGHGYTNVHMDDLIDHLLDEDDNDADFESALLALMIAEVERVEGKPIEMPSSE